MKLSEATLARYGAVLNALPKSFKRRKQERTIKGMNGSVPVCVTVRWDDECGNGHNTFAVYQVETIQQAGNGDALAYFSRSVKPQWFPGFEAFHGCEKWHLFGPRGPLYYVQNTIYKAGDRDHNDLRKGETVQIVSGKTGLPCWRRVYDGPEYADGATPPDDGIVLKWEPWTRVGEGKERDLKAARSIACWPDATDAQLMAEPDELANLLIDRLPAMVAEFKQAVERMGFTW